MADKLRVVIDARKSRDFGIGTYIRGLVGALSAMNELEMTLILSADDSEGIDVDSHVIRAKSRGYSIAELFEIGKLADRSGAELLHVPHYVVPFGSRPLSVTIHDTIHLQLPRDELSPVARRYAKFMLGRAARKADAIFTPTVAVMEDLAARWPKASSKLVVTPNAVSCSLLESPIGRLPKGLEKSSFLLFVGNEKPHKNVLNLVRAFARVRDRLPGLELVLVGGAFETIRDAGVVKPGRVDEETLRSLYSNARLLVQPSTLEGFGLPVIEAMAHGCPVAISEIPALMEVAGEGATTFDPWSVEQMADAIERLLRNDELIDQEKRRGPLRSASFSWEETAVTTFETWRRILSGG